MSDDLIVFLRDRLAEDEAKARAVTLPSEWHQGSEVDDDWADWDPKRVLADVASKRAILAWHSTPHTVVTEATTYVEVGYCSECDGQCTHKGEAVCECCGFNDGCPTVRHLATTYADHTDYQEGWKW